MTTRCLSKNTLQLLAIVFMTLDHIAWHFIEFGTLQAQIMHFFGRMTAPIMCFFIAEGFRHSKSIKNYLGRMLIFASISQVPFILLQENQLNMLFTLVLGLTAICIFESQKLPQWAKIILIASCVGLSYFCDWMFFGVLWILCFHIFNGSKTKTIISFCFVWLLYFCYAIFINERSYNLTGIQNAPYLLYTLGSVLALLLVVFFYNGKKGKINLKWLFYSYYPLHLMLIWLAIKATT